MIEEMQMLLLLLQTRSFSSAWALIRKTAIQIFVSWWVGSGNKSVVDAKSNFFVMHVLNCNLFTYLLLLAGNIIKSDRKRKTNSHGTGRIESSLELINATLFQEQPIKCHLIRYLPDQPINSRNINQRGSVYKHPVPNYKKK